MMKLWIFHLVAIWVWSVAIHHHIMANDDQDIFSEPKPTIRMYASDEVRNVINDGTDGLYIVGFGGLCLEANNYAPKLVDCKANAIEQQWKFYDDETIRSAKNLSMCLTCNDLNSYDDILILPCSFSSSDYKVWRYRKSDKSIENVASGLVMDLRDSQIGGSQLFILYPYKGTTNQKWDLVAS